MQDVTKGSVRLRGWPRGRGKKPSKKQKAAWDKFMNAQRATKYFAPEMYKFFMDQVEGSPLLPRDAMTMMLFNRFTAFELPTGRILWPVPAYQDVSQAIDVITAIPGNTIFRGPSGWEPITAPGPQQATKWTILSDITITVNSPNVPVIGIGGWNEYLIQIEGVTATTSGIRALQLSVDNGASYFTTNGDYVRILASGATANSTVGRFHTGSASGARSGQVQIIGNNSGSAPLLVNLNDGAETRRFDGSLTAINAFRVQNSTGGSLTGGRILTLGR